MVRMSLSSLALGLLIATAVSAAQWDGGRVTVASVGSTIERSNSMIEPKKGTPLLKGDTLRTAADGGMQAWLLDDSMIAMASASELTISPQESAHYTLAKGGARIVSGTKSPTVSTSLADVAAIGTDFSVFHCPAPCEGKPGLYVRVDRGKVRVTNRGGEVTASAGSFVFASSATVRPTLISVAPTVVVAVIETLLFDIAGSDFIPDLPIQPIRPIPPDEQPGSPS